MDITIKKAAKIYGVIARRMQALVKQKRFKTARMCECGHCIMISEEEVREQKKVRDLKKRKLKR